MNRNFILKHIDIAISDIELFQKNRRNFFVFVNSIDTIISILSEYIDKNILDQLRSEWGILEDINADMIEKRISDIEAQFLEMIEETLVNLIKIFRSIKEAQLNYGKEYIIEQINLAKIWIYDFKEHRISLGFLLENLAILIVIFEESNLIYVNQLKLFWTDLDHINSELINTKEDISIFRKRIVDVINQLSSILTEAEKQLQIWVEK